MIHGFLMLDGLPESIDNTFGDSYTVACGSTKISNRRRSMITTNTTVLESPFDHAEETVYVYCNYPKRSYECENIFHKNAENTIIKLPDHVGEGPFARVVSIERAPESYQLPHHHIRARALESNDNEVYKLKFGYNFHLIKHDDGPISTFNFSATVTRSIGRDKAQHTTTSMATSTTCILRLTEICYSRRPPRGCSSYSI